MFFPILYRKSRHFQQMLKTFVNCGWFFTQLSGIDSHKILIEILRRWVWMRLNLYGWQAFLEIAILGLKTGYCANFYAHHCMYSKSGLENQFEGLTE